MINSQKLRVGLTTADTFTSICCKNLPTQFCLQSVLIVSKNFTIAFAVLFLISIALIAKASRINWIGEADRAYSRVTASFAQSTHILCVAITPRLKVFGSPWVIFLIPLLIEVGVLLFCAQEFIVTTCLTTRLQTVEMFGTTKKVLRSCGQLLLTFRAAFYRGIILGYTGIHDGNCLSLSSRRRVLAHRSDNTLLPLQYTINPLHKQVYHSFEWLAKGCVA